MVRAVCGVQLSDRKYVKELILGFNAAIGQLTMAKCVHWYGHILSMDGW